MCYIINYDVRRNYHQRHKNNYKMPLICKCLLGSYERPNDVGILVEQ